MTFESTFFGPGNRLRWEAIQLGSLPNDVKDRLGPFIEDLRSNPDVLLLPRVREDGRVQWYVLCSSARHARIARDEVRAFLGPTYSDFDGRPTLMNTDDSVEAAVIARYGRNAFRFEIPQRELFPIARERLRLLVELRSERPTHYGQRIRSAGRILRDFEFAVFTGNDLGAADCIAELRTNGYLSASNLLFLEVRRLAATNQWQAIFILPELDALLAMVRPRRVTEALLQAVYSIELKQFEDGARADEALPHFRTQVLPRFGDLYRSRAGLSGHEIDASFLMAAAAAIPPRPQIAHEIIAKYDSTSPIGIYLVKLAQMIPDLVLDDRSNLIEMARAAFSANDVDGAYELAIALTPSFERCALLLRCAHEMGTLAATQCALSAFDSLSNTDRTRLEGHAVLRRIWNTLAMRSPSLAPHEEVPSSWPNWLQRLAASEPWVAAHTAAESGSKEWNRDAYARDAALIRQTADLLLTEKPDWGKSVLRDALPYLLDFFISGTPDPRLRAIYENLFLLIAADDQVSVPQVGALVKITEYWIQLGVESSEYDDIVRQVSFTIEAIASPATATIALEALDMLVAAPCPSPSQRQDFCARVAAHFQRWYKRIDAAQWTILQSFGEELLVPISLPQESGQSAPTQPWRFLDGKRIAMYSLRESALRRAQSVLQRLCPSARIEVFHDQVGGSHALRTAAANVDLFVLATAAAKHSATSFIESNRPKLLNTIYARSQGSASLIEAILEYATRRTETPAQ